MCTHAGAANLPPNITIRACTYLDFRDRDRSKQVKLVFDFYKRYEQAQGKELHIFVALLQSPKSSKASHGSHPTHTHSPCQQMHHTYPSSTFG